MSGTAADRAFEVAAARVEECGCALDAVRLTGGPPAEVPRATSYVVACTQRQTREGAIEHALAFGVLFALALQTEAQP